MICAICDGQGWILTCIDDLCRGAGECMHGDGDQTCWACDGLGFIGTDEEEEDGNA